MSITEWQNQREWDFLNMCKYCGCKNPTFTADCCVNCIGLYEKDADKATHDFLRVGIETRNSGFVHPVQAVQPLYNCFLYPQGTVVNTLDRWDTLDRRRKS
ncbi:MAG: hypothetical protein WC581_02600 [Thermodesulfovibrionales bacterium]